jgi:hypothetical protein
VRVLPASPVSLKMTPVIEFTIIIVTTELTAMSSGKTQAQSKRADIDRMAQRHARQFRSIT